MMTRPTFWVPAYMPQLGISPQNFSTPLFGAALSDRSVPSVRLTRNVSTGSRDGATVLADDRGLGRLPRGRPGRQPR